MLGKIFINRGDRILVESPTYLGALQAWNAYGAEYITVPSDENGMVTDQLESALRIGPKFMYVLPNFQNPTGTTLPLKRREQLVELADKYGVPIIEDDPYGQLRFEGEHIPSVMTVDNQYKGNHDKTYNGNVIYLSTFSKILAPGLAPGLDHRPAAGHPQADPGQAGRRPAYRHLQPGGGLRGRSRRFHRRTCQDHPHRSTTNAAMRCSRHWKRTCRPVSNGPTRWVVLFLWVTLPEEMDTVELFKKAVEKKVAFVPGYSFHPDGRGKNTMRLNFSYCKPEIIREGIARLAQVIKEEMAAAK